MSDAMEQFFAGENTGLSLQTVFAGPLRLDLPSFTAALRAYHVSMTQAEVVIDKTTIEQRTPLGVVRWGEHAVKFVAFDAPLPAEVIEGIMSGSHYGHDVKLRVQAHQSHMMLYYGGTSDDAVEQYIALAAVVGALASQGAIAVLNETGRTSLPIGILTAEMEDRFEALRELPLLVLFAGFVKYVVEGVDGVWMRTYGNKALGLPDLSYLAEGHDEGQSIMELMSNVMSYMRDEGAALAPGHTMELGEDLFLKVRAPEDHEEWLESDGDMLVLETVGRDEIGQ